MKSQPTPRRRDAVAAQRAHGQSLRERIQTAANKAQAAIAKRRQERIDAKEEVPLEAGHTPTRVLEVVSTQRGQNHADRRRRYLQRRSDARYNAREDRRQERARLLAEAEEQGIPGTLIGLPPMRRWDDGTVTLTRSSNVPHVNPARTQARS